ncbi:hypothetical protein RRG08_018109 [Elysia crispata]|uniref:Uncharacterized protein n=1 Tax=Elysia crispata TaxID=231223 RepID=A0AAE0ZE49_9GAST|nr:hypothetical protein RRG08_018109 [Elysia crispata]
MEFEEFIPETHEINLQIDFEDSGNVSSHFDLNCSKKENHNQYLQLKDLTLASLPLPWRDEGVLGDLKQIGDRVVHLTVLQLSPSRQEDSSKTATSTSQCKSGSQGHTVLSHEGSGFLTFNKRYGPVVHTSKHVVRDRFEAERTVVRLFYDDDKATGSVFCTLRWLRDQLHHTSETQFPLSSLLRDRGHHSILNRCPADPLLYAADGRYFESFIYSDYTAFSCDTLVDDHFPKKVRTHPSFSFVKVGNKQLVLGPQLDVAIISHPHGMPKAIAFGKMKPLARLLPAMYTAATCPGSSGAPFIRLHSNTSYNSPNANILTNTISTNCEGQNFISAGLFVHHGFYPQRLKLGMGTVRPPITLSFPTRCSGKEMICWVVNTFSLCEDFLLYWMLLMFDHEQVEPFIKAHLTMFTIIVPLAGVIFSYHADLFRVLWTGFWMHITCSVLHWFVQGPHITPVLCGSISAAFSVLVCVTGWSLLQCFPQPFNFIVVSILWFLTLWIEWHFSLHKLLFDWFIRTFREGKVIPVGLPQGGYSISEDSKQGKRGAASI